MLPMKIEDVSPVGRTGVAVDVVCVVLYIVLFWCRLSCTYYCHCHRHPYFMCLCCAALGLEDWQADEPRGNRRLYEWRRAECEMLLHCWVGPRKARMTVFPTHPPLPLLLNTIILPSPSLSHASLNHHPLPPRPSDPQRRQRLLSPRRAPHRSRKATMLQASRICSSGLAEEGSAGSEQST